MNKSLLFFFCLALINSAFGTTQTNSPNLQGSKSGSVTIYKRSDKGFYVGADFKENESGANDRFGRYTFPMDLGLYTSQTLLPKKCLAFNTYDCDAWNCRPSQTKKTVNYPYFSASGNLASADVYVDYSSWSLYTQALYADSCETKSASNGSSSNGILGMGVNGKNLENLIGRQKFSIYLNKDLSGGELIFNDDNANYANSSEQISVTYTDQDWKFTFTFGTIRIGDSVSYIEEGTQLIFDINENAIGFPLSNYNAILSFLSKYGVICNQTRLYQPTCLYTGYISSLPTIILKKITGDTIPIPPEIYVQNSSNPSNVTTVTLNLRALGNNLTGNNYVTADYNNSIILDANFMRYYYTVFDATFMIEKPRIILYIAGNGPTPDPSNFPIVATVIALIVAGLICYYLKYANKKDINNQHSLLSNPSIYMPPPARLVSQIEPQSWDPQQQEIVEREPTEQEFAKKETTTQGNTIQ